MSKIKVRLVKRNAVNVKLKPQNGVKVKNDTTYLYDPTLIADFVDLSEDWAIKTDGLVEEEGVGIDYSSKAYAIGGTGTETNNSKYYSEQAAISETNAGNSATSASNSASTATTQAGIATTKAGQAATSEANALSYSQSAATSANDASHSAADAYSSEISASSSASTATTQAGIATSKAGEASGYASDALSSKNAAATSETNAQTWAEGNDAQVSNLGGEHSSKGWAAVAKALVDSIGSVLHYKGSVATRADLPTTGQELGDMYNITSDGSNVVWNGSDWDDISGIVDLSAYRTAADQDAIDTTKVSDVTVNGTSVVTSGVAEVTVPTSADYWTVGTNGVNNTQTSYSRKLIKYSAAYSTTGDDQQNGFRVLGDESASTGSYTASGYWMGRMMVGTNKRTFLLGVTKNTTTNTYMCGIGAHSWTDAESQTGAAWEDIYIQPDGNKAVYLGGRQWRVNSGWFKVQNDGTGNAAYRTSINVGTNTSPTWRTVLPNQASGTNSVLIRPNISSTFSYTYATSINGTITANYGSSFGYNASAGSYGVAIGYDSAASGTYSIQIGRGTNSTANTMNVGLSNSLNVQLLDSAGEVPDARIKTTIARLADLATVATTGTLASLTDTDIASLTSGQYLMWDGTKWKNTSASASVAWGAITGTYTDQVDLKNALDLKADISSLATVATSGLYSDLTGTPTLAAVATTGTLASLSDATITSPTSGQALLYDGSKWVNGSAGVSATYDSANERITFA